MVDRFVNYNQIAPTYDQRYAISPLKGVAAALHALAEIVPVERILEVGCGTGRWLAELEATGSKMYGLDLAGGMLHKANGRMKQAHLTLGRAGRLPFREAIFDLVFCVNALHHFKQPAQFIFEARRLLRTGGALVVVGMNPNRGRERWYLYRYFEGTYETDLHRFPSPGTILEWMIAAGFDKVEWSIAEHILASQRGREVLDDYFLQKHSTSQLTLLTDETYAAGLERIKAALAAAKTAGETLIFPTDISMEILIGRIK